MRVGANPDLRYMKKFIEENQEQEFEIEPISANIVTKDFFNPKKVQKGPQMGENTILG